MMNWDPDEDRYCKLIMTIITIIIYLPWTYYLIWLANMIPTIKMQLRHLHVECAQFLFSLSEHVAGMMWFGLSGCCCIWPTKTWCPSCRDVRRAFVGRASVRKWVEKSMNTCFTWWIDEWIDYNRYTIHVSFLDFFWTQNSFVILDSSVFGRMWSLLSQWGRDEAFECSWWS